MRDWSSDVCSSDLAPPPPAPPPAPPEPAPAPPPSAPPEPPAPAPPHAPPPPPPEPPPADRKRGVQGQREAARVDPGASRIMKITPEQYNSLSNGCPYQHGPYRI